METIAIAISIKARKICKIVESLSQFDQMFGRSIDGEILRCMTVLDSLESQITPKAE